MMSDSSCLVFVKTLNISRNHQITNYFRFYASPQFKKFLGLEYYKRLEVWLS